MPDSVISPRRPDESAADYLLRIERGLRAGSYTRWIATDAGQRALEDAAAESRAKARAARILEVAETDGIEAGRAAFRDEIRNLLR